MKRLPPAPPSAPASARPNPATELERTAVLDAAARVVAAGAGQADISEIHALAGVSMGAIYALFDGRAAIERALGERAVEHFEEQRSSGGDRSIADLCDAFQDLVAAQPVGMRALTGGWMAEHSGGSSDTQTPRWDALIGDLPARLRDELGLAGDTAAASHTLLLVTVWHALAGVMTRSQSGEIPAGLAQRTLELGGAVLSEVFTGDSHHAARDRARDLHAR